jgi:hypothetical protein
MKSILSVAVAAAGLIIAFMVFGNAYKYRFKSTENISVTGLAEKDFSSDQIVWSGNYNRKTTDLKTAYSQLKEDEGRIRDYLIGKGITEKEILFSAVSINKEYSTRYNSEGNVVGNDFSGYNLSQTVTVDSKNIDQVEKVSREITELIQQGIEFNSNAPSYYYSRLSELKIDLLAKASADARIRAETIAKNAGSKLGAVRMAAMGVFQITGLNSNEDYSYGGALNTSSRNKTASITIRMEFAAD